MSKISHIFERLYKLTREEGQSDFISYISSMNNKNDSIITNFEHLNCFLQKIINEIDELVTEISLNESIMISVKNQKLLRTCFQLIVSLGISTCLIPGLGVSLTKRCTSAISLPQLTLTDEQKYELLVVCTDFFTRCYKVPVLKTIIMTLHLCDYLAALIQLAFAPLKKPGTYKHFVMTQELYDKLNTDRVKYVQVYEQLITNCFQPSLIKELLVLQSVNDPPPPAFVKRTISKELSQRLLAPGGLLSLIRCFMESNYDIDTGMEWKKIDMICKIVSTKHGGYTEETYLSNICSQLSQILSLNNPHYLSSAVACALCLNEKYPQFEPVKALTINIFQAFNYENLISKSNMPGTVILCPDEIEHKLNILHACLCTVKLERPINFEKSYQVLFFLGVKCTKNEEVKIKLKDVLLKCLEKLGEEDIRLFIKTFLVGNTKSSHITVQEFDAGLAIKCGPAQEDQSKTESMLYFLNLFRSSSDNQFVQKVFMASLSTLLELSDKRKKKIKNDVLLPEDDDIVLLDDLDENYAIILQLLSEISLSPKVITVLKANPSIVLNFIEHLIFNTQNQSNDECLTIALVLLNTILSNTNKSIDMEQRLKTLMPILKTMSQNENDLHSILCKESLSLLSCEEVPAKETACNKAIADVFDNLLPVRAHGIIKLTKLIEVKDTETISKKHYIFCLLQEQLKDADSYVYLSAINGIAALGTHCPEDVLNVLCKEFLQISTKNKAIETKQHQNKIAELRMKVGDIIVKVTKSLGEMAIVHKTLLLNTMLCGCRDDDPLIRTSALSNLAEVALVLHYKLGSIIYEILLIIWNTIESDRAIECRRAAVMVISSLLKGLGKETLIQLKDDLLPIYRILKKLYRDENEDSVMRLHAQIALEELNDVVSQFLFPEVNMEKQIFVLDKPAEVFK